MGEFKVSPRPAENSKTSAMRTLFAPWDIGKYSDNGGKEARYSSAAMAFSIRFDSASGGKAFKAS
jgi:hypothetical protein